MGKNVDYMDISTKHCLSIFVFLNACTSDHVTFIKLDIWEFVEAYR